MKKLLVFLIVIAMMLTAQTAVFAEVNMVPTYGFDSYAELYFALTDSDSKLFEDLTAVKYYQFSDAYKNTLDAFATKKVRLLVPTIYGEYARLRNAEGLSNITFFADELYSLPWIWYNCKVDGDYDLQIRLNYLSLADIENLDKATSYNDVVPLISPDAPDGCAPNKATYQKEITLDILGQEKTVMARVSELENSDLFYVHIYCDGILLTLRADGQLFTDEFFASFGMQTAVFEDENNGEDTSLGDINGNYQIDSMDYVLLKRAYFGTYIFKNQAVGDINGNRQIDSMDYVLLKRAYFGTYDIAPSFSNPDEVFSYYLDSVGFKEGLSQHELLSQMEEYSYNGTPVRKMVVLMHYDGETGGGCEGEGDLVSFRNDYSEVGDGNVTRYNSFTTKVQLDNMPLPNGITFDDNIETALSKCKIEMNPETDFRPQGEGYSMLLYSDIYSSVQLIDCQAEATYQERETTDSFEIRYKSITPNSDGSGTLTRTLTMAFDSDKKLCEVSLLVKENYKRENNA